MASESERAALVNAQAAELVQAITNGLKDPFEEDFLVHCLGASWLTFRPCSASCLLAVPALLTQVPLEEMQTSPVKVAHWLSCKPDASCSRMVASAVQAEPEFYMEAAMPSLAEVDVTQAAPGRLCIKGPHPAAGASRLCTFCASAHTRLPLSTAPLQRMPALLRLMKMKLLRLMRTKL
jgi:hypothetical protein